MTPDSRAIRILDRNIQDLSETVRVLTEGVQAIMSNQNNLNSRLNVMENKQNPLTHNPPESDFDFEFDEGYIGTERRHKERKT